MTAIRKSEVTKEQYLFLFPDELNEDEGGPETINGQRVLSLDSDLGPWPDPEWDVDIYRMACNELKRR